MTEAEHFTAMSLESLQAAIDEAFQQVPGGPEGVKAARIVEQRVEGGGFVGRTQYIVTIEGIAGQARSGAGNDDASGSV